MPDLAKGLRNMRLDSPIVLAQPTYDTKEVSPFSPAGSSKASSTMRPDPQRSWSGESTLMNPSVDSSWDVVEDLPIRWATDYVALASPGTRLCGTSVLCYDLWIEPSDYRRGAAYLAVVVKTIVLLYHAPKGERAFRFVKVCSSQ